MASQLINTKNNPQISATNEKMELKRVDQDLNTMKNRVQLLRLQLQKEKDQIKKNKNLVKQVIEKKVAINRINQFKLKDNSQEERKIQELRKRNKQMRQSHGKELQNIQKAIYLVKLDDARQLKNVSIQHQRKILDMERQFLSAQKQKKKKVATEAEKAKERYMKYWKEKLQSLYTEQAQNLLETMNQKQAKKKELKSLEQQEIKLLQEINKFHSQQVQTKKQYLAALSIPVKDVAQAMGDSISLQKSSLINTSLAEKRYSKNQSPQRRSIDASEIRLPNTHVNQAKLKIILTQLKKSQRKQGMYSARN